MSSGKIIAGVAAGVAAGVVLGVLFAPEKGADIRRKISQKGNDLKDSIKTKFNGFVEEAADEFENVKDGAERLAYKGKEKFYRNAYR
jgi:gas vesicle protein